MIRVSSKCRTVASKLQNGLIISNNIRSSSNFHILCANFPLNRNGSASASSFEIFARKYFSSKSLYKNQKDEVDLSKKPVISEDKKSSQIQLETSETAKSGDGIVPQNSLQIKTEASSKLYLSFTCTVCNGSNSYMISKRAYKHGVVIVSCKTCSNHHLIADNLDWFPNSKGRNIEEIMKEKGEKVIKVMDGVREILLD